MLWLVISSLVMGVAHVPTGACFAAIVIVCGLARGAPALEEKTDLQIASIATHITELIISAVAQITLRISGKCENQYPTFPLVGSIHQKA